MDLLQRLVVPLHLYASGFCLIGFFHHHLDKLRLIQIGINNNVLSLLNIDAAADNQFCIFS